MTSSDMSVGTLFKDFLSVPDYQREYVWDAKIVEKLLEDVQREFDSSDGELRRDYFLGTIVTTRRADDGVFELIDGQQRVTTLYIALIAIRDWLKEKGQVLQAIDQQLYGLNVDNDGHESHLHHVQLQYEDSQGILADLASDRSQRPLSALTTNTRSASNIVEAYKSIRAFIDEDLVESSRVRRFYAYLTQHVYVIRIEAESTERALWIFETINARGRGLDSMDLLKNLLFRHAKRSDFDRLKERWKAIVDTLFQQQERPLGFIQYYILANHAHSKVRADDVYTWMTDNAQELGYRENPVEFATELLSAAQAYVRYLGGQLPDGTKCDPLANILLFNRSARQHLILMLAVRNMSIEAQTLLATELERLSFVFLLTRQRANVFEQLFVEWAAKLRNMTESVEIVRFFEDTLVPTRNARKAEFEAALRTVRTDTLPKYRLKFILGKMAQHLDTIAYGMRPLSDYTGSTTDIEHILPIGAETSWKRLFGDDESFDLATQKLSNLTLLERSLNASAANGSFQKKLTIYGQSRFLLTKGLAGNARVGNATAVNRALAFVEHYSEWTPETMKDREDQLVRLATAIWYATPVNTQ